jgi:GH18 family chitinase
MANQFRNVAYLCTNVSTEVAQAGSFTTPAGDPFFGVACLFAANLNGTPAAPILVLNDTVTTVLTTNLDQVRQLQALGIKVLLSVLNNRDTAGWSEFTDFRAAQDFAVQCADAVTKYGLDGIDIDDEYSSGTANDTSLIMATYALTQAMPGKVVSKALFNDRLCFKASWEGRTLAENLTYGWEMSYGHPDYAARLDPYLAAGMAPGALGLGVSADSGSDGAAAGQYVAANDLGGVMVFDVTARSGPLLDTVCQGLYGAQPAPLAR